MRIHRVILAQVRRWHIPSKNITIVSWLAEAAALSIALVTLAAACAREEEVPLLERRAQAVNQGIMCPVCPGESIDQSQHPLAVQMRAIVAEKIQQGWTEQQIRSSFVESYGPMVLLEPPRSGANLAVWLVPPIALALAGALLYWVLRTMRRSQLRDGEGVLANVQLSEQERASYFRRVEASLLASEGGDGGVDAAGQPSDSELEGAT